MVRKISLPRPLLKRGVPIVMVLMTLTNCVTKNKAVESTKTDVEANVSAQNKIDRDFLVKSNRGNDAFTAMDFASAMNAWKIGYDGQLGDSFRFWMNKTDEGFEAGAEGTGSANAEGENRQLNYEIENHWRERFDSLAEESEKRFAKMELRLRSATENRTKEKEVKGTTAGIYIIAGVLLIVVIFIVWLEWRFRKLGKSVQAFLNFKNLLKDG